MLKLTENDLQTLLKPAASAELSPTEKAKMRMHLDSFMEENPVQVSRFSFLRPLRSILASLTVVVFFSGVSVASAQAALPGDTLYDFKILVNEDVPVLFMNKEQKQDFAVKQVDNRLNEAEQLKAKGTLDEEKSAVLQAHMDTYFSVIAKSEKPEKLHRNLSLVLDAHTDVLPNFTFEDSGTLKDWKDTQKDGLAPAPVESQNEDAVDAAVDSEEEKDADKLEGDVPAVEVPEDSSDDSSEDEDVKPEENQDAGDSEAGEDDQEDQDDEDTNAGDTDDPSIKDGIDTTVDPVVPVFPVDPVTPIVTPSINTSIDSGVEIHSLK